MNSKNVATAPARRKPNGSVAAPVPKTDAERAAHLRETARTTADPEARERLESHAQWIEGRLEDVPFLRRDVASVLPSEFQDADLASLVYALAGAEGHTEGVADAACYKAAAELRIVRYVLASRLDSALFDAEIDSALRVMVDAISQRLDAAGEIERRRIAARKGEVKP